MHYNTLTTVVLSGKSFPDRFSSISIDHDIKLEQECDGIYSLQYSFDGRYLAVGCGNGTIRVRESKVFCHINSKIICWGTGNNLPYSFQNPWQWHYQGKRFITPYSTHFKNLSVGCGNGTIRVRES